MKDSVMRRLRDKGLIALIAALFSLGLWMRVVGGEKMEVSKTVVLDYRLPHDLALFSPSPSEVTVRVRGPAPFVNEFQKQDFSVVVDLTKYSAGDHEVAFRAEQFRIPIGIDLTSINPPSLRVLLDREIQKRLSVRPVLSAQLSDGYKVDNIVVEPSTVEVKGSRIRLGLVSSIPTDVIYLTENSLNQTFEVGLNFAEIWGVEPTEKISSVHVEVNLKGPSKRKIVESVPIKLKVGTPSKSHPVDLEAKHIHLHPKTINLTLEGPQSVIESIKAEKLDVWVQMNELKSGSSQQRLTWRLPPELRILDRSTDTVTVVVP